LTAIVASAVGTVLGYFVVTELMRAEFVVSPMAIALTASIALISTISLGLFGTWRALGMKAAPLLRNK
jgi:putative ABC transport system permease protein